MKRVIPVSKRHLFSCNYMVSPYAIHFFKTKRVSTCHVPKRKRTSSHRMQIHGRYVYVNIQFETLSAGGGNILAYLSDS